MANSIKENEYIKLISPDEEGNISLWDKLIKEFNNLMKGQNENPDEIEWIFRGQVSDCKDKKDNLSKDNIQESLMGELKWGGSLKYSEQVINNRLRRTTGIFDSYVTEGDGIREAAAQSCPVYDLTFENAIKQSNQLRDVVSELLGKI